MKRSIFLLISALGSLGFGGMMFFAPSVAANLLGLTITPVAISLIHGMGGLIIGTGTMNLLFFKFDDPRTVKALLLTNIVTHLFGLGADAFGILDGTLTAAKMAPVEATHLFIGIGSLIYLIKLSSSKANSGR